MSILSKQATETIFTRFAEREPEPKTELDAPNAFCLLVSIVLSAQSTDVAVNKATAGLYEVADSPEAILALGEEGLKSYIKTIGLYNSKARNIIALCRQLLDKHGGDVPHTREALQALPGVGRKTANVWLNCVRADPYIAVDTHVFRVSNRLGLVEAENVKQCEEQLEAHIPERFKQHAHHWLILHGRYSCTARKPDCPNCLVRDLCLHPVNL